MMNTADQHKWRCEKERLIRPAEYQLEFRLGKSLLGFSLVAKLTSAQLDRTLHPEGAARVMFEGRVDDQSNDAKFVVTSFQLDSLAEYLQCQAEVRRALETELGEARANWLVEALPADPSALWRDSYVDYLYITPRKPMSAELQERLRSGMLSEIQAEEVTTGHDQPDTRSTFSVMIKVGWDEEHGVRLILFRDGNFVKFDSI